MRDDPEFNIKFVALVESFPCLYDYNNPDYIKKQNQDNAWKTIAEEISETVQRCKERWKNVRGSYTRHLKSISGGKLRKPYYLAEHLNFLHPFTKSRGSYDISIPEVVFDNNDYIEENDNDDNSHDKSSEDVNYSESIISRNFKKEPSEDGDDEPAPKRMKNIDVLPPSSSTDVTKSEIDYLQPQIFNEDPDLAFLKSILPDMKDMNKSQKRQFKIGILNLAGQILNDSN